MTRMAAWRPWLTVSTQPCPSPSTCFRVQLADRTAARPWMLKQVQHDGGGFGLAPASQVRDRLVDQRLVGGRVEAVADEQLGGGGGGGCRSGADLVDGGALGGGDLVLGHAGAPLDQGR